MRLSPVCSVQILMKFLSFRRSCLAVAPVPRTKKTQLNIPLRKLRLIYNS